MKPILLFVSVLLLFTGCQDNVASKKNDVNPQEETYSVFSKLIEADIAHKNYPERGYFVTSVNRHINMGDTTFVFTYNITNGPTDSLVVTNEFLNRKDL